MDREVVADELTKPKAYLVLDTDWATAALSAVFFVFCMLATGATARHIFSGVPVQVRVTWHTVFLFGAFAWLAIWLPERLTRFGCGLLTLAFGSRIVLAITHASAQIQVLNGEIMRVAELLVMVGFCIYIAHWFKRRIKRI